LTAVRGTQTATEAARQAATWAARAAQAVNRTEN
jgi:hypothetical protein